MSKLRLPRWLFCIGNLPLICCMILFFLLSALSPAGANTIVSGNISADTIWSLSGSPYIVNSSIAVVGTDGADGVTTLTIEPGVEVRFNRYGYMTIGGNSGAPGALVAQGTATEPIVFTSNEPTPAPGDWYCIEFKNTTHDSTTEMKHCTIAYAGYGGYGALYIENAAPTIDQTTISHNGSYSLQYIGTVGGTVTNATLHGGISLLANGAVNFSDNTLHYNNAYPVKTYADHVGALTAGISYENLDADSRLMVDSGNVTRDATWAAGIPISLSQNVSVIGTDGPDNITTLTIEPGAEVRFNRYGYMTIGAASGDPGALVAEGTAAQPIVFTSNEPTPAPGDWYCIEFKNTAHDSTTKMKHCTIAYAGYGGYGPLYIDNAAPAIDQTTISHSASYSIQYVGTVGGTVTNSTLHGGISLLANGTVNFSDNTLHYNNAYPVKTYADNVGALTTGISYENLDADSHLLVSSGNVTKDATWAAGIPIRLSNYLVVQGVDGPDGITTLTIAPGAKIRFDPYRYITVGATSGDPGALVAKGESENLIVFTSNESTPAPGNWDGIYFYPTADDANSILEYSVVEYAGYGNQGAVHLYQSKPSIRNNTLRNNQLYALKVVGTGANGADIQCNTIQNNGYGIYATSNAEPMLLYNNFKDNASYGVYNNSSPLSLNAENNWWNTAAGPNAGGDATYGNVDADPWSTEENNCVVTGDNHPPNTPTAPVPEDNAVRVNITNGLHLSWTGGDPDPLDTVVYDLYRGSASDALILNAQDLPAVEHQWNDLSQGMTYFWQVVAKDSAGAESTGPVWRFTTDGGPPDLSISSLSSNPSGNLQSGQSATFTATIQNSGGPVLEAFVIDLLIDGASIGTHQVDPIVYGGDTLQQTWIFNYTGGNPTIEVKVDSLSQVIEGNEANNNLSTDFSTIMDNTAPALISTSPSGGAAIQQAQQITAALSDSQSAVDDAAVIASFTITDSGQQVIPGNITEANDTFTFVPNTLPMADSHYTVSLTATDTHGNTQAHAFSFTIDTQPPAKPAITGGTVSSGTIQARPVENTADEFHATLTGTREPGTSVWLDGVQIVEIGDDAWTTQLLLSPGANSFEVWLVDRAGNRGGSEWVDIEVSAGTPVTYEYDDAGRVKTIQSNP